ncbi:MAG: hypothetical protein ACI8QZ_002278 [Chlamydiales bacterium]|jgi:hypothetical protein
MNLRPTLLLSVLLAWTSVSCVFSRQATNEPIDPARVAQLMPGETSAQAAVELLGAPTEVVQLGYRTAYRYDRSVTKDTTLFLVVLNLRGSDTRQDRIWLFFDEDEILTHTSSTFAAERARYKLPWSKLHEQPGA